MLLNEFAIDTLGHFVGFFFLTWLVFLTLIKFSTANSSLTQLMINLALSMIVYAALSELGQYVLGFRHGEVSDFIADLLGIITFTLLYLFYALLTTSRKKQHLQENKQAHGASK